MLDVLGHVSPSDRPAMFNKAIDMNPEANRFMSPSQFKEFVDPNSGKPAGFAAGGSVSVYDPDEIDEIMNSFDEPTGYAKGGEVEDTLDTFVAPRYRKQRATPSSEKSKAALAEAVQFVGEMLIPQSAFDAGLMLIPGGKIARKAGAALIGLDASDAEAGSLSALKKFRDLIKREAPEQANQIREALLRTMRTGKEHSVIGLADEGGESVITKGTDSSVLPNTFDLRAAKRAPGSSAIVDFHTHPGQAYSIFETAPSPKDFQFYSTEYPSKANRNLRTLIAVPPTRDGTRRSTSYNFFETQDPTKVFDPRTLDAARFELQRAGGKGSFKSIQDDPILREYFDYGGDLGSLLEDAAPLALMRYRAGQGIGRHELQLGGKQLTPSSEVTDIELFRQLERPAMEVLKSKKFAKGGPVRMQKGGVIKAALEEVRNRMLRLKELSDQRIHKPENLDEYPTRFYRGMASMVKGGEDSPKYIDDITKEYLNSREPLSSLDSLVAAQRPSGALSNQKNMRRNNAWAASNPLTAASYATTPNSVMIPLELTQKPGAIFDAQGERWDRYFSQTGKLSPMGNYVLRDNFADALRDPEIKSILVKNIIDPGEGSYKLSSIYDMDIGPNDLMSSNLLIKDPSVVKYRISDETPTLKERKVKKAKGGSVSVYDPGQIDAIANQYM
jgi:hypothetical protein